MDSAESSPTAACRLCLPVCHQSEGGAHLQWKLWSTPQMPTPEGVLMLVLAGLCDGENQCADTDGSELEHFCSSSFPYTAGI